MFCVIYYIYVICFCRIYCLSRNNSTSVELRGKRKKFPQASWLVEERDTCLFSVTRVGLLPFRVFQTEVTFALQ
jgi:hypothetical protein